MSHTGTIVEVRKDVFAPAVVVRDPQTGESVRVEGKLIEAGTDYLVIGEDPGNPPIYPLGCSVQINQGVARILTIADLRDVQIPRDQQEVGLPVKFDVVGDHERGERVHAVNVVLDEGKLEHAHKSWKALTEELGLGINASVAEVEAKVWSRN